MITGLYEITGRRNYRGHEPGTKVMMRLDPRAETRALYRGDIRLIDRLEPSLPERYELPAGWLTEAPRGASFMKEDA